MNSLAQLRRFLPYFPALGVVTVLLLLNPLHIRAQELSAPPLPSAYSEQFYRGVVLSTASFTEDLGAGVTRTYEQARVSLTIGDGTQETVEVEINDSLAPQQRLPLGVGDRVLVSKVTDGTDTYYYLVDKWRLPALAWIGAAFFGLVIWWGRRKGLTSFIGLALSIVILAKGVIPLIIRGYDPFTVSITGAGAIAISALFIAHGFRRRTSLAVIATLATLCLAAAGAYMTVTLLGLSGTGTEESAFLAVDAIAAIDLRGLLLGGILIGALGVLDDITTAQAAVVEELHHANPQLSRAELYRRGLSVGREHITSLVNTLVLAYAGASFPLFLLFSLNTHHPWWLILNSEFIMEEVARTLVGSAALVLAVPITTALAAYHYTKPRFSGRV